MGFFSFLDNMKSKADADLKRRFKADLSQNMNALIAFKGERNITIQDLEQETIYYACDILLHQKAQEGRLPADVIMTDIIKCATDAMQELFPKNYQAQHAAFAQDAVRINLFQAPDLQQIINNYYSRNHR